MAKQGDQIYKEISLNGRLITSEDPTKISENFQTLTNMRYTDDGIKGIGGNTKANASAISTQIHIQNGFHFRKEQPAESHILVQATDTNDANPKILQKTDAVPATGNFSGTAVFTEDTAAGVTRFADAPNGQVVACNGKQACIWGGDEIPVAKFITFNASDDTQTRDYTDEISNTDTNQFATLISDTSDFIEDAFEFAVTGATTMASGGTYTGTTLKIYKIRIFSENTNGDPDTYEWSNDNGATWDDNSGNGYDITGGADAVELGITVTFSAIDTADEDDTWRFTAYPDGLSFYVASTRPLKGVIFDVGTANTTSATLYAHYWNGSVWAITTNFSDGTASGGAPLAKDGTYSFDSTEALAKVRVINGDALYWYRFLTSIQIDNTTTVIQVTNDAPYQTIKDIWDGRYNTVSACYWFDATTNVDNTLAVFEQDYNENIDATFLAMDGMTTVEILYVGFSKKMTAMNFEIRGGGNPNATIVSLFYWDGTDWTSVGQFVDGTSQDGKAFATSGIISWTAPASEFKTSIKNELPSYYYKITVSANFGGGNISVDFIGGIPVQENIGQYKFPIFGKSRTFLCSRQDKHKNSVLVSGSDTPDVYNGVDSTELFFGDDKELTTGISLYSQKSSSLFDINLFYKANAMFGLEGFTPGDFQPYTISDVIGCVAPGSLKADIVQLGQGQSRPIVIWQATNGIYLFDNTSPLLISKEIQNFFDKNEPAARRLHPDYVHLSESFIDAEFSEYHWKFADGNSSGTLNREWVLDLKRSKITENGIEAKWFEVDRTSGMDLQCGFQVQDTIGNKYVYAGIDTGYLQRLENGTDFDGNDIVQTFQFGDIAPIENSVITLSQLVRHKLIMKDTETTAIVTATHYGDGIVSGAAFPAVLDPTSATHRFVDIMTRDINFSPDGHIFHSTKYTTTTGDKNPGFHPLFVGWEVNIIGGDL